MTPLLHLWGALRDTWQYRHEPEIYKRLAGIYWALLLFVSVLVLGGLISYAGLKFYSVFGPQDNNPLLSGGGGAILFSRQDLREAMEVFEKKRQTYEYLRRNPSKIPDPSR